MKRVLLGVLLLSVLISTTAHAGKVALVPVRYVDAGTSETIDSASQKVEQAMVEVVNESGHQLIKGVVVADAFSTEQRDGQCDKGCLKRIAGKLGADEVVMISVEDDEQMSYLIEISFASTADAEDVSEERTDGFFVVLEWMKGKVSMHLKNVRETEPPPMVPIDQPEDSASIDVAGDQSEVGASTPDRPGKKLSKMPFIVAAASTVAFGTTFLVLNAATVSKYDDVKKRVKDGAAWSDVKADANTVKSLQTAEKVFLGLSIAGLVTTGVLGFLTDWQSEKISESQQAVRPIFFASDTTAGVGMIGQF